MSMKELKEKLYEMVRESKTGVILNFHVPIIETILRYYATQLDYYEWDAIETMKRFLERGVLSFESSKKSREIYCAMH